MYRTKRGQDPGGVILARNALLKEDREETHGDRVERVGKRKTKSKQSSES